MFGKLSISLKLNLLILLIILGAFTVFGLVFYQVSKDNIISQSKDQLSLLADKKLKTIRNYFEGLDKDLSTAAEVNLVRSFLLNPEDPAQVNRPDSVVVRGLERRTALDQLLQSYKNNYGFQEIYLIDNGYSIIYSTKEKQAGTGSNQGSLMDPDGETFSRAKKQTRYSSITTGRNNQQVMHLATPVLDDAGERQGLLVAIMPMKYLFKQIEDTLGLGNTGETVIGRIYGDQLVIQNTPRNSHFSGGNKSFYLSENGNEGLKRAARFASGSSTGKTGSGAGMETDYEGTETLAAWRPVKEVDWGLEVKMDMAEVLSPLERITLFFFVVAGALAILAVLLTLLFTNSITRPVNALQQNIALLGQGILPEALKVRSRDEIGQMAQAVNQLVSGLKDKTSFARDIGQGNFDADFQPLGENDVLGDALLRMRDSLQESERREAERNWIVTGVAEVGEILRRHNNLGELGDDILEYITGKVEAIQGAFYTMDHDEDSEHYQQILLQASYAYNKKKHLQGTFQLGEGLVGQAAIDQDIVYRTRLPHDYVSITSGILGDQRPQVLLLQPLIANEKVYGVLELASFHDFSQVHLDFLQELSEILAQTIFNIQVNERTLRLLNASQKMSEELQEQQQELRNNAEEMAATQEELQRSNQELEKQMEEVSNTQKRMQTLLENASEVITIYESDGTVRYVSPSIRRILGYEPEDMIGIKDIAYVHEEGRPDVEYLFKQLQENPEESVTIQFSYLKKDGERIWMEATGTNLLNDQAIQGIVVNSRDITERRRAEKESRMRGQMQALSENSPDLITRVNIEGTIFYVNPIIEEYTGYTPAQLLQQSVHDEQFEVGNIFEEWRAVLDEVQAQGQKLQREITFKTGMGDRIMQVNAIPEFTEKERLESVLLVSHDITESKLIQMEIQSKNKKIAESINYAQRIQNSIMPNTQVLRKHLPESFIFFKPKDVVSGDFPWFMPKDNAIYVAAVDCTGHGVPGALMSLIGYFLLNDIVRHSDLNAAEVLDRLTEMVTKTLRQDEEDSQTKDGMDIAMLKLNTETGQLDFSGAHRSLYYLPKNGEQTEYKGNKFPIGGGKQYKKRTNFTNYTIPVKAGDTVFFCSDGYPDQFGGDFEQPRKIGPKRIRQYIADAYGKNMDEIYKMFEENFVNWQGEEKQMDDVLMMGIRFQASADGSSGDEQA